mmetsp:Transcript_546/g.1256  ORF Transcript_546/g.1256 Transcript_546/m.1256 type:complete len:84 (-) Transcript_546:854-1105(-)
MQYESGKRGSDGLTGTQRHVGNSYTILPAKARGDISISSNLPGIINFHLPPLAPPLLPKLNLYSTSSSSPSISISCSDQYLRG